jgi:hypothetical protein
VNLPQPPTNWDIDRLTEERTEAVSAFGFTERQARFSVEVLIHSGVFVERHYCAFAGITHGQKTAADGDAFQGRWRERDSPRS